MKINKPFVLLIPALLVQELDEYLSVSPPKFTYQVVYFYYVVHYIAVRQIRTKDREFITIDLDYLKSITASNIRRYISILKTGGFIETDNYLPGIKSYCYRLNLRYFENPTNIIVEPDSRLFKRIKKSLNRRNAHINRLEPFLKQMRDVFMNVEVDYQKAEEWIQDNAEGLKKYLYSISLIQLQDKRFRYFDRNRTNKRLDTNFTNLKKDLRQFIVGDKVSIDLKNSQPFFLYQVLKAIIGEKRQGTDTILPLCCYLDPSFLSETFGIRALQRILLIHKKSKTSEMVNLKWFSKSVLNGSFYDDFVKIYPNEIDRDEVKLTMLKVLFSRNTIVRGPRLFIPYEAEKKVFSSVFPFVGEAIKILKEKDHAKLAIYLQRFESYIFIDCIAKQLVDSGIVPITIHDSIIIEARDQRETLKIMKEVFIRNFGVLPSFHVEHL